MTRFHVGKPAPSVDVIDREHEIKYLVSKMRSKGINYNVATIGHRRIGKTSILLKVRDILSRDKKFVVVYFDVKKNMAEPKIFLNRLEKTVFDAYMEKLSATEKIGARANKMSYTIPKILSAITSKKIKSIGADLSPDGIITPKIEFGSKVSDYSTFFLSVFSTPTAFAEASRLKFVVVLDEFQEIAELKRYPGLKNIFALFRSIIQERGKDVSFIVSGSRVHMLESILGGGESPLFLHFERQVISEMDETNSINLFNKYLKARKMGKTGTGYDVAKESYQLVGGQPFYLMALAEGWQVGETASKTLDRLLREPLGTLRLYAQYVLSEDLRAATGGPILRTILSALSDSDGGYTYSELSKKMSVPMSAISRYIPSLVDADLVNSDRGALKVRDKVIHQYLKQEALETSS